VEPGWGSARHHARRHTRDQSHRCGSASCHPEGRADALNWDLVNDGLGNPNDGHGKTSHLTPGAMEDLSAYVLSL